MKNTAKASLIAAAFVSLAASAAHATTWSPFIIRQVATPTTPLYITGTSDGSAVSTLIDESGEKTGYGTSDFNGQSISTIDSVSYTRLDAGNKSPYLNIWVTDGTHYAVIAPQQYSSYGAGGAPVNVDVNGQNIQSLGVNIYETDTSNLSWLAPGAVYNSAFQGLATYDSLNNTYTPVKVSDLYSSLSVYGNTTLGGSGATKSGTGFNLVFGDTQGNFSSPVPYSLANVSAVPEPASLALIGVGSAALLMRRRRKLA